MKQLEFGSTLGFEKGDKLFHRERDVHFYFCQEVHRLHFRKWGSDLLQQKTMHLLFAFTFLFDWVFSNDSVTKYFTRKGHGVFPFHAKNFRQRFQEINYPQAQGFRSVQTRSSILKLKVSTFHYFWASPF